MVAEMMVVKSSSVKLPQEFFPIILLSEILHTPPSEWVEHGFLFALLFFFYEPAHYHTTPRISARYDVDKGSWEGEAREPSLKSFRIEHNV